MSHIACKPHNFQASSIEEASLECPYCQIERLQERVDEWRDSADHWQAEAVKTASELSAEREKYKAVCKDRDEWKESHYQKLVVIAEWMDKVREMEKQDATAVVKAVVNQDELRTLRAIINGKLSKRKITPEQQAKMQAARQKVI